MKKNIHYTVYAVLFTGLISFAAMGCASSMATHEELAQLEAINMEIQSLEQQKTILQKEHKTIAAAIDNKESQLSDINKRKNELGQTN